MTAPLDPFFGALLSCLRFNKLHVISGFDPGVSRGIANSDQGIDEWVNV